MRNNEIIVFCNYPTKSKHYVAKVGYTNISKINVNRRSCHGKRHANNSKFL